MKIKVPAGTCTDKHGANTISFKFTYKNNSLLGSSSTVKFVNN